MFKKIVIAAICVAAMNSVFASDGPSTPKRLRTSEAFSTPKGRTPLAELGNIQKSIFPPGINKAADSLFFIKSVDMIEVDYNSIIDDLGAGVLMPEDLQLRIQTFFQSIALLCSEDEQKRIDTESIQVQLALQTLADVQNKIAIDSRFPSLDAPTNPILAE